MFTDYSYISSRVRTVFEEEKEKNIFTFTLKIGVKKISNIEVNFNTKKVELNDDFMNGVLGSFNNKLKFDRSKFFYEILFINTI